MKFGRNNGITEGRNDGTTEGHGESSIAPLFQSGAIIKIFQKTQVLEGFCILQN